MIRLALTPGEPAGIGPELLVRLVQNPLDNLELLVVADPKLLRDAAHTLKLPLDLVDYCPEAPVASGGRRVTCVPVPLHAAAQPGQLNTANAPYVLKTLELATDLCLHGIAQALITGPVHKGVINDAGIAFTGHTEFLAERSGCDQVVMMLATEGLRVALATTHLPLRAVADAITQESLQRVLEILHWDLQQKFGLAQPRILVCGLNPHAGEGGHLGREEIDIIAPVLERLRREQHMLLDGPLPADTLFTPQHLHQADAVLAMYHDQGLPVLKAKGFNHAVNITLGLPFIRTSVDHGTALDLAGRGTAHLGSLETALAYAEQMVHARQRQLQ